MKRLIFVIFLFCFFTITINTDSFSLNNDDKETIISLESSNLEYNLGKVEKDKIINKVVRIRNKLDQAIAINSVRSTCECIKVYSEPKTVDRNDLFDIEITLDTKGMIDNIEEVVYVLTENKDYQIIRFVILASIINSK